MVNGRSQPSERGQFTVLQDPTLAERQDKIRADELQSRNESVKIGSFLFCRKSHLTKYKISSTIKLREGNVPNEH